VGDAGDLSAGLKVELSKLLAPVGMDRAGAENVTPPSIASHGHGSSAPQYRSQT
jgi:hypothetical protein